MNKFYKNGDSWGEDEILAWNCGSENGNRTLTTTNVTTYLETVCYSLCYSCDFIPETIEVTFQA